MKASGIFNYNFMGFFLLLFCFRGGVIFAANVVVWEIWYMLNNIQDDNINNINNKTPTYLLN